MARASFGCRRAVEEIGFEIIVVVAVVEVHAAVEVDAPAGLALAPPELRQLAFLTCFADMPGLALAIFEVISLPGHTSYSRVTIESREALHINSASDEFSNFLVLNHLSLVTIGVWSVLEVQDVKMVRCRGLTADTMVENFSAHMTDILDVMKSSNSVQNMDFGCCMGRGQGSVPTSLNDFLNHIGLNLCCS